MLDQEIELIVGAQRGDQDSLAELYNEYFPKIYKFIFYKTQHKETAEDLTSQTFGKALESLSKFDTKQGYFSAWLYRIARNNVIDYYRKKKPQADIEIDQINIANQESMEEKISNKQLLEKIQKNLGDLKPEQREIIVMRVWNELSYKEIAGILNKTEDSCKMAFSRAIKTLRTSLVAIAIFITTIIIKIYG